MVGKDSEERVDSEETTSLRLWGDKSVRYLVIPVAGLRTTVERRIIVTVTPLDAAIILATRFGTSVPPALSLAAIALRFLNEPRGFETAQSLLLVLLHDTSHIAFNRHTLPMR